MLLLLIAAGGAMGAMARHGLVSWVETWAGTALPWGTLLVNTIGSFLIGLLMGFVETASVSPTVRAMLAVGLLGSFTTFSTYAHESVALVRDGQVLRAAVYSLGSLAIGGAAVCAGLMAVLAAAKG